MAGIKAPLGVCNCMLPTYNHITMRALYDLLDMLELHFFPFVHQEKCSDSYFQVAVRVRMEGIV